MKLNIGIGFVTGRHFFQNVLKTYINNWLEHGLIERKDIRFHLFIAYDLKYKNTQVSDYKNIPVELAKMVDSINFYGADSIANEAESFKNIVNDREQKLLFGSGYGRKRNIVTYFAIKKKMDKLIFIDDDEYPMATVKNSHGSLMWMGQSIISTHLKYNDDADITHGYHCGYISPIPFIKFGPNLLEQDFKLFIDAISNDIINWQKIKTLLAENKGVTYADLALIENSIATEVLEEGGMKFISGANLCFNLKNFKKLPPFYNPPGARGEDTFMSTALSNLKVVKVPCYTFHDGFSMYNHILTGVLPNTLAPIEDVTPGMLTRFAHAAIGWIRYKPLLVYINNVDGFEENMEIMERNLSQSIPKLRAYFKTDAFDKIHEEFTFYRKNVKRHFEDFESTKVAWAKLLNSIENN